MLSLFPCVGVAFLGLLLLKGKFDLIRSNEELALKSSAF